MRISGRKDRDKGGFLGQILQRKQSIMISVRLPYELAIRVLVYSQKDGSSYSDVVRKALREFFRGS